jgi:DNA-binding SARP family transcriptional activator
MPRLAALGGLALLSDVGPVAGSAARARNLALLALLARAGAAGMSRDKIAAFLWPESDAERARHSLNQAVYTLRRELGQAVLLPSPTALALNRDVIGSDVVDFERRLAAVDLAGAVACYGGPFLDGFHLSDAPDFERWVDDERMTLHRAYVAALEKLVVDVERIGDAPSSVGLWRRLVAAEPLSAPAALGLTKALAQAGDRSGAILAARLHAEVVARELGAPPDPSVSRYAEELRRAPAGSSRPVPADPAPVDRHPSTTSAVPPPPTPSRGRPDGAYRWRTALLVGGATVALLGTILSRDSRETPHRPPGVAVLPFENETGESDLAPLGRMTSDWITEGLVATGLVHVTDPGRPRAAEGVVSGRIYRTGDSLRIQARITRARDGQVLRAPEAVAVAVDEPSRALSLLRERVLGALGTLYDERIATWTEPDAHPPSYAAYQAFAAGVDLMAQPRDLPGAEERFRRAAALDTSYVLPRLWLAWSSVLREDFAGADSLTDDLGSDRDHMSTLERAWLDRMEALLAGDSEASFLAARRMVEAAPGSGWAIALASAALDTGRPSVTVSVLRETGMDNLGLEAGFGWFLLTSAYHELGQYRLELAASEEAVGSLGLGWGFVGPGVPALAALGRFDALERRLEELRHGPALEGGRPAGPTALLTAATELRAHGFADEARTLVDRWLATEGGRPGSVEDHAQRELRIDLLYEVGRWDEAEGALAAAPHDGIAPLFALGMKGLLAARAGDTAGARRVAAELAANDAPYGFGAPALWRARIDAVLGDDGAAVALLREAFAHGQGGAGRNLLHVCRDFDGLRDRADFEEVVRPRQ